MNKSPKYHLGVFQESVFGGMISEFLIKTILSGELQGFKRDME